MNFSTEIQEIIIQKLINRHNILLLACSQRSKFEQWLKFELADALACHYGFEDVIIEPPYPSSGMADLKIKGPYDTWYIELKTCNTNWRIVGVQNKTRPITKNINGIIDDFYKLKEKCSPHKGILAFILFPIPVQIWTNDKDKLLQHIDRIESECSLDSGSLMRESKFIEVTSDFGVGVFVVEAV